MGCTSKVTAVFYTTKEKFPVMKLYVDEHFPKELKGELTVQGERAYVFKVDSIKWYGGYPAVASFKAFVENFLKLANAQEEPNWHYEFVRIGEVDNVLETHFSDSAEWVVNLFPGVNVNI